MMMIGNREQMIQILMICLLKSNKPDVDLSFQKEICDKKKIISSMIENHFT
jgi:hypothetical protein